MASGSTYVKPRPGVSVPPMTPVTAVPVARRLGALAGVAAPVSFVGGWLLAGARADRYSPLRDAISQLARVGAPTRPLMTSAFVAFGVLAPVWAVTAARVLDAPGLRASVTTAGLGTLAVAALPLGASFGDTPHAVAAGVGYVAMAVSPLLGGRALGRAGRTAPALASYGVGAVSTACLAGSLTGTWDGGFQRLGLGVVDAWFVVLAARAFRGLEGGSWPGRAQ